MAHFLSPQTITDMVKNAIYQTKIALIEQNLGKALKVIQPLMNDRQYADIYERIRKIDDDYNLMLSYLRQGYSDPSKDQVYQSLLRKLDRLANEATLRTRISGDFRLQQISDRTRKSSFTPDTISKHIEDYVSELALIGLNEGDTTIGTQQLHQTHHQQLSSFFEQICISGQWNSDDQTVFENLILSPTTDYVSAALLVSAITLSSITYFDLYKYKALARIYHEAEDEHVRQRALVGWALTTTRTHALYPEISPLVEELTSDETISSQLMELQTQMFFCVNAENDQDEIRRDIMPNLMKNKGFEITRHGIVEKEDDPMQDILDPEASDRSMEELERSFQRMSEMQRNGSDIYFGGFSQMKRYPFFYTLSNWFCPFYADHPGLQSSQSKIQGHHVLSALTTKGLFCDSDKYSFALALANVIDKIPESMKTALQDGAAFDSMIPEEQLQSPATIRLLYLQDLYRFFRISDFRNGFYNPFGGNNSLNALFLCNDILNGHIAERDLLRFGNFLLKRNNYPALDKLLSKAPFKESASLHTLKGHSLMRQGNILEALSEFKAALALSPDNKRALSGFARSSIQAGLYTEAEPVCRRLRELAPDNKSYILNHAIALLNTEKTDEASALLFKLHYEHPDDMGIGRVLAWCLLLCKKGKQAQKLYERILTTDVPQAEDYLNAGYCHWINGEKQQAIGKFKTFIQRSGGDSDTLLSEFKKDKQALLANSISEYEMNMMSDIVNQ